MRISCCMILKNEDLTIEAALSAVLPAVDEFVIGIDSATVDNTAAIVRDTIRDRAPLDLYGFTWEGDFSKVRNEGIERATGDWVLIIDGHEIMRREGVAHLREIIEGAGERLDQIHARLYHRPDEYGNPGDYNYQARLLRKASGLRYKHAQHNFIPVPDPMRAAATPQIIIDHRQPEGRKLARAKQNREHRPGYFRALVEKNPEDWWSRHYLAVALKDEGDMAGALREWTEIVDKAPKTAPRWLLSLLSVIEALGSKGKHGEAVEMCKRAWPEYMDRREPYILLGCAERSRGNIGEAIRYLNIAAHMPEPFLPHLTLSGPAYTWLPFKELAEAYVMAGNLEAAWVCAERALEFRPGDKDLLSITNGIKKSVYERDAGRRPKVVSVIDRFGSFSGSIVRALEKHNRVRYAEKYSGPMADRSDVVYCDWCDHSAIAASRNDQIPRLVVKLHTYEAYGDMPAAVDWTNVDAIVYPAEHVYRFANERFNLRAVDGLKQYLIHNPVDTDRFALLEKERTKRVAWLSYVNWKKGIPLLFQVARHNPDYEFFVGGKFQDWDSRRYFEAKKPDNVRFDGWIEDVPAWFADKSYVMNTSLREGLGVGPLQGMAMGLKPIIHAWPGADEGYPEGSIFELATDVREMLEGPIESDSYRAWVCERHDTKKQLAKLASVILGEGTDADDCLQ